jgi:hypothetical protein
MDWAHIHLPPNTYQCIGGMVYALCLISKAAFHQEDMMKREEHGERVKRTPMQLVQVLSVHTSYYPPMLDGAKLVQRDSKYDFLELKTYMQWKLIDGEGTSKKLKEGVERSFKLIKNAINSTFGMKPQARAVLLDLVLEFKMMFHELFITEVNLFYEETLNKVGVSSPVMRARSSVGPWSQSCSKQFSRLPTAHEASPRRREGLQWTPFRPMDTSCTPHLRSYQSSRSSPRSSGAVTRNSATMCLVLSSRTASRRLCLTLGSTQFLS